LKQDIVYLSKQKDSSNIIEKVTNKLFLVIWSQWPSW